MPSMEEGQPHRTLSRKDLQKWCKKLGLPARRSSSVMAESLRSYFQKHEVQRLKFGKSFGGCSMSRFVASRKSELPLEFPDAPGLVSATRNEGSSKSKTLLSTNGVDACRRCMEFSQAYMDALTNKSFESSQPFFVTQCTEGDVNKKQCMITCNTKGVAAEGAPTRASSSFEFYVSSDEGIKLCIDFNYKPSEWIKKCKNEVNIMKSSVARSVGSYATANGGESSSQIPQDTTKTDDMDPGLPFVVPTKGFFSCSDHDINARSVSSHMNRASSFLDSFKSNHIANEVFPCNAVMERKSEILCKNLEFCNRRALLKAVDSTVTCKPTEKLIYNGFLEHCCANGAVTHCRQLQLSEEGNYIEDVNNGKGKFLDLVCSECHLAIGADTSNDSRENDLCGNCLSAYSKEQGRCSCANGAKFSVPSSHSENLLYLC